MTIRCKGSIEDQGNQLEVTCKIAPNAFKKHFLGLSDNVTYFAEQVETADVSVYLRGDVDELIEATTPD